jgi:hypothetical protein
LNQQRLRPQELCQLLQGVSYSDMPCFFL